MTDTFLGIFLGSKTSPRMIAWNALPEETRRTKMQEGIEARKAWAERHRAAIVGMGGPLGKMKKVSDKSIEDVSNLMSTGAAFAALQSKAILLTCKTGHQWTTAQLSQGRCYAALFSWQCSSRFWNMERGSLVSPLTGSKLLRLSSPALRLVNAHLVKPPPSRSAGLCCLDDVDRMARRRGR
jgi:hypothetical protein